MQLFPKELPISLPIIINKNSYFFSTPSLANSFEIKYNYLIKGIFVCQASKGRKVELWN